MTTSDGSRVRETIGQRLRRLRTDRGLSQRELAAKGVSYAYISRIEAGTRQPSVKALRQLARKLNVSPEYLETGSDLDDAERRELRLGEAELELRLGDEPQANEDALVAVLDEATLAGDLPGAARAQVAIGLAASRAGDSARCIERLEPAIGSGFVTAVARPDVYATLGRAYVQLGEPQRAVELFERSLRRVEEDAPDNAVARTRFATYLSYALADAGELGRAEDALTSALDAASDITDPYTHVRLCWGLARLASMQDRQGEALDYVRRAIALLEATEDELHLARAHVLCASILILNGNADRSEAHLERARVLFGPRTDPADLASLCTEEAKAAGQLGRGADAVERAREALALLGDDDPAERGSALAALADGLALEDEESAAGDAYAEAVELLEAQGRWRDAGLAARAWARFLRGAGREHDALDVLERAAELAERTRSVETRGAR